MPEWFEDSEFWEILYPVMFPEEGFAQAEEQLTEILKLIPEPGRRVLDLCSGPGRISVPLAKMGFEVTGVDITRFLLDKAEKRANEADVTIEQVNSDMRDFIRPGFFDLVLNLYTSFGYCKDRSDDLKILKNVAVNLKPGGTFLMDVMGKEIMARIFQPITSRRSGSNLFIECHEILDDWERIRNEWIYITGEKVHKFLFEHSLYSARELTELCETAGLIDIRVYGGFDGRPYNHRASRLVLMAKRE